MGTTVLSIIQADLARTREIREDLAAIETAAHAERRALNEKEEAKFSAGRDEILKCEARVHEMLRQAERANDMLDGHLRLGIDTDVNAGRSLPGGRTIGGISPLSFTDDTLHELHDAYLDGRAHAVTAETRAITAAPMAAIPTYNTDPIGYRREPTRIASLMPVQSVETAQATYYRASAAAAAADTVATGGTKPESTPGWEAVNVAVRKIAHYTDIPTEYLSDFPSFAQVIGTELTAGLIHAENGQILDGTGVAPDLTGLLNTTGILTYAPAGAEDYFESVLKAITQLRTRHRLHRRRHRPAPPHGLADHPAHP